MVRRFLTMFDEPHELIGWFGMACILVAYAGVSGEWLFPHTVSYQCINLVGAVSLLYSAARTHSYPVVALNIAWALIALLALYGIAVGL